jgi:hypothetical protein
MPAGEEVGVPEQHVDRVSFVAIVMCLAESGHPEDGFYVDECLIRLTTFKYVVFPRVLHSVPFLTRQKDRITLNLFY